MKTLNRTLVLCASLGACIALIGTPAKAVNVDVTFNIPVVGRVEARFTGFDFNRNGYIRSSEGEVQSAITNAISFEYGSGWWQGDDPNWIDIEYYYWATSISPNVIETQLNRFHIESEFWSVRPRYSSWDSFSYTRDYVCGESCGPGNGRYFVDFSDGYLEEGHGYRSRGTSFNYSSRSTEDFLQTMSSAGPLVPEPSTYAMLLAGLGALGFVACRRKG